MGDGGVVMTEIKLRDYQREAIDAVFGAWSGGMQRPAIVLPTGAGKTVVFSALVREFRARRFGATQHRTAGNGNRVMILAHRDELVDQAIAKLRAVMPGVNVGKVKAADNDVSADVIVASVQTLASAKRLDRLQVAADGRPIGLIITDECHHAAAASYQKIYEAFPDALQLGVTATMARGDGRGLGSQWEDVVYQKSILWMISKNYLVDVRTRQIDLKALDLGGVKSSRGDWQAGDLGKALMESEADTAIARAYREHAGDHRQGIVFTPTVETARAAANALNQAGVKSAVVSGETTREDRAQIYADYRRGARQVLVNCMVLTEGFDMPQAEVAVIARPTQSAPLYTQMVGRVLRPYPGKTEALVLDLVGASANKLRTLVDLEPDHYRTPIRDGESLAEAEIREETEANQKVPAGSLAFELRAREVNVFETSDHAWVRTPAGVLFINCGETYVFLWPSAEAGLWDVCTAERRQKWQRTQYTGLDLGSAMAWGEAVSEDYAAFNTRKSARWRKSAPSQPQLDLAARLGVPAEGLRRGELSTAIDVRIASSVFDRHVRG